MIADPAKAYARIALTFAIAIAVMLLTTLLFMGGRAVGKGQATKQLAAKNAALADASRSLGAAAKALRAVDAEAKRRIKAAKDAELAAAAAAGVAKAAEDAAKAQAAAWERRYQQARHKAACAAVFDFNVDKECPL